MSPKTALSRSKNVLYYGKPEPLPAQQTLQAGPLTALFEAGDLRRIRFGETEVLRRLYWAIRDRNWGTPPLTLSNLKIQHDSDSFLVAYDAICQQAGIDFRAHATIRGERTGEIRFEFSGDAHSTFLRNRLGFCVLHPMDVANARTRIEHVDGTIEEKQLPLHIASQLVINGEIKPVIPFNEMRALTHEVQPGLWAEVRFAGDTFEMEDQRNWTDASFKTYCTPLRLPFPVEVKAGDTISQSVTLKLLHEGAAQSGKTQNASSRTSPKVMVNVDASAAMPLPKIGLGIASHGQPLQQREIERLRRLSLAHLRVDLKLAEPATAEQLQRATTEVNQLGVGLEVALHLSENAEKELADLRTLLQTVQPPIARWLVFHQREKVTAEKWLRLARTKLADFDSRIPIIGGTNIYFTELNSRRPDAQMLAAMDGVAWSINPQVHAFDNSSLVETLAAQAATATSARQFCGDRPLFVTPITLQPRFNPNATGPEPEPLPGELPTQVDVRQMSLFGAAWTLGSIRQLAQSGEVASLTYFETTGWRGVMERSNGSPLPAKFQSIAGGVFPLYHVFADVGEFVGGEVLSVQISDSLQIEALALRKAGRTRLLLANMSGKTQRITLQNLPVDSVQIRFLDERNVEQAMRSPGAFRQRIGRTRTVRNGTLEVELLPYALARIDSKTV